MSPKRLGEDAAEQPRQQEQTRHRTDNGQAAPWQNHGSLHARRRDEVLRKGGASCSLLVTMGVSLLSCTAHTG